MKTLEVAVREITESKPDSVTRDTPDLRVGEVVHQGDCYMTRVADDHPRGKELGTRQVAVGTTVGSRHVVEGEVRVFEGRALPPGFTVPEWTRKEEMQGPVVVAEEAFTLTHPEHAHHKLPAGTYQVTYQADYSTRQRVQD